MNNILLINASQKFGHSKGNYNNHLHQIALDFFINNRFKTEQTIITEGYQSEKEVKKILWADLIIYQMPGWWMGVPWKLKEYIDKVFTEGHGSLYLNDGRSKDKPELKYGSGGLLHDKKYMISSTWNAPIEAFNDKDNFFEGLGIDKVYYPFHKAHQFMGLSSVPTFLCSDVMKNPRIEEDSTRYIKHLKSITTQFFV